MRLTIRRRVFAFVTMLATAVALLAGGAYLGTFANRSATRAVEEANTRYRLTMEFASAAQRYAEHAAELMLLGEEVRPGFEQARADLDTSFALMERHTRANDDDDDDRGGDRSWTDELDQLRPLFSKIDHTVERAVLLNGEGNAAAAQRLFRDEVQARLDARFRAIVGATVAAEQEGVKQAEARALAIARRTLETTLVSALILVLIIAMAGANFARALLEPIDALTRGAQAIEEGSLSYRIGLKRPDELGRLSRHFDRMAERLQQKVTQLASAREGLEQQVQARTVELDRLNRRLTELDRQRVRFLADVSHEMRTPLTVLRGEAEVTLRGAERPAAVYREALVRIVEEAADMGRLIDDLLFLARSEMGEVRFDEQRVQLSDVVLDAVESATVLSRQNGIEIEVEDPPAELAVMADPRRLRQVFMVVLDNAVKYSDPGSRIDVAITTRDEQAVVTIADQGRGIPAADLPFVFDRFYRGENGRAQVPSGSGLGLHIARWIVERHRGTIAIDSRQGQGTSVLIHLPLHGGAP